MFKNLLFILTFLAPLFSFDGYNEKIKILGTAPAPAEEPEFPVLPNLFDIPEVQQALGEFDEDYLDEMFQPIAQIGNERAAVLTLALCEAIARGDLALTRGLVERGADVNAPGYGPVAVAYDTYFTRQDENPRLLNWLDHPFDNRSYDEGRIGLTPLATAVAYGRVDIFQYLLKETEANYFIANKSSDPVLRSWRMGNRYNVYEMAIIEDQPEILEIILGYRFESPNAAVLDKDERPLHLAARYHSLKAMRVLMAHGACPLLPNKSGKLPIEIIRAPGQEARLQANHSPSMKQVLTSRVTSAKDQCVLYILKEIEKNQDLKKLFFRQSGPLFVECPLREKQKICNLFLKEGYIMNYKFPDQLADYISSVYM